MVPSFTWCTDFLIERRIGEFHDMTGWTVEPPSFAFGILKCIGLCLVLPGWFYLKKKNWNSIFIVLYNEVEKLHENHLFHPEILWFFIPQNLAMLSHWRMLHIHVFLLQKASNINCCPLHYNRGYQNVILSKYYKQTQSH